MISILRNLKYLWGSFKFYEEKKLLGRWGYTKNIQELDRKIYLANHDNCASQRCCFLL
jgi:hypothetical protein